MQLKIFRFSVVLQKVNFKGKLDEDDGATIFLLQQSSKKIF